MNMLLQAILVELDRLGSHIVYNTLTKRATLFNGYPAAISPISGEELLELFGRAWITNYDSLDGEHCYRITRERQKSLSIKRNSLLVYGHVSP